MYTSSIKNDYHNFLYWNFFRGPLHTWLSLAMTLNAGISLSFEGHYLRSSVGITRIRVNGFILRIAFIKMD